LSLGDGWHAGGQEIKKVAGERRSGDDKLLQKKMAPDLLFPATLSSIS
jgi:hypothetical protein